MARVVTKHPMKRPLADVPVDDSLEPEAGWGDETAGMAVQWIVTDQTVGAAHHVVGLTVFQPGAWIVADDRPLGREIEAFLDAGAPPIYFGFGSMRAAPELRT